jgi:hypothetical protein
MQCPQTENRELTTDNSQVSPNRWTLRISADDYLLATDQLSYCAGAK